MDHSVPRLKLFGGFRLSVDGVTRHFATRKAESLLAYLALANGRPVIREKILSALWPETADSRARGILSTTLWRVQKALSGVGLSVSTRAGRLSLDTSRLEVDALQFKQVAESSPTDDEARLEDIERVLHLYEGELLEDVDEGWCEPDRIYYRTAFLSLQRELITTYRKRAMYSKAISMARRVIELDPMDEDTHRELMLLLHLEGNRAAALTQYRTVVTILQSELGIAPDIRTTDLWRYIRSSSGGNIDDRLSPARSLRSALAHTSANPMVGRREELDAILHGLDAALDGQGSFLIVSGEVGIGKTRLVEAARIEAGLRGFEVLEGRCTAVQDPAPYQVFIEATWPRISRRMQADTAQVLRDFIARLSPAIRHRKKPSGAEGAGTAILNETLLDLLSGEPPVLLVLEDMQYADQATHNLVHLVANRVGGRKLVVLLSVRSHLPGTMEGTELMPLPADTQIRLEPLSRLQTYELIRNILRSRSVDPSILSSIWERTAGIPFAVVEYARFLAERAVIVCTDNTHWAWADSASILAQTPRRIQALLRGRIQALTGEARTMLVAAAVLGYEADLPLLEELSGFGTERFEETVSHLLDRGLLAETGRGYRFGHESYRLAALSTIGQSTRRALHKKAADLMEAFYPARIEDLCWHFLEAGLHGKAMGYAEASGDKARAVHANGNALKWYTKAIELLTSSYRPSSESERRVALLLKRQETLGLLGRSRRQLDDLDEIAEHARQTNDAELLARIQCLRAHSLGRMNRNMEALRAARIARQLYISLKNARGQARSLEASALIFMSLRDVHRMRNDYERALRLYESVGDGEGAARAVLGIGTLMLFTGRSKEGLKQLQRIEATLATSADQRGYAQVLLQKGVFCRCLGRSHESERLLATGISLMKEQGDRMGEARGLSQLAYTHMTLGSLRQALHEARRSIQLAIESGDTRGQIVLRNNAAYAVFRCIGDFKRAQRCVHDAISLVKASGQRENLAIYYDTLAAILHDQGEYSTAYYWAKESKRLYQQWSGQFDYVGAEIEYHTGSAALALRKNNEARACLSRAVSYWRRSHDRGLLAHGLALLGLASLAEGAVEEAVQCAQQSARVLRHCTGAEALQHAYWVQAEIYRGAGYRTLADRALARAYALVIEQSSCLKGRLRRSFLTIPNNRRIVEQYESQKSGEKQMAVGSMDSIGQTTATATTRDFRSIVERRGRLLHLIRKGNATHRILAETLGVSERTVRSDIAALRGIGIDAKVDNLIPST